MGVSKLHLPPKWPCSGTHPGIQMNFSWGAQRDLASQPSFILSPYPRPHGPSRSQAPRRPWESGDFPENPNRPSQGEEWGEERVLNRTSKDHFFQSQEAGLVFHLLAM